jgi:hypothetical protein
MRPYSHGTIGGFLDHLHVVDAVVEDLLDVVRPVSEHLQRLVNAPCPVAVWSGSVRRSAFVFYGRIQATHRLILRRITLISTGFAGAGTVSIYRGILR